MRSLRVTKKIIAQSDDENLTLGSRLLAVFQSFEQWQFLRFFRKCCNLFQRFASNMTETDDKCRGKEKNTNKY